METHVLAEIHQRLAAIAPIVGISVPDENDTSTWRIDFDPSATTEERSDATTLLNSIDLNAPFSPVVTLRKSSSLPTQINTKSAFSDAAFGVSAKLPWYSLAHFSAFAVVRL